MPVDQDNLSMDELLAIVPLKTPGINLEGFRFDPITDRIMALIDGMSTIGHIADVVGEAPDEVIQRIQLLRDGNVVTWLTQEPVAPEARPTAPPQIPEADVGRPTAPPSAPYPPRDESLESTQRLTDDLDSISGVGEARPSAPAAPVRVSIAAGRVSIAAESTSVAPPSPTIEETPRPVSAIIEEAPTTSQVVIEEDASRLSVEIPGVTREAIAPPPGKPIEEQPPVQHSILPPVSMNSMPPPMREVSLPPPEAQPSTPPASQQPEVVPGAQAVPTAPVGNAAATGTLSSKDVTTVLLENASTTFSGAIRFVQDSDAITFHFIEGDPRGAEATAKRHDAGAMMHRMGLIDTDMLRLYRASMEQEADAILALRRAGIDDKKKMAKLLIWWGESLFREVQGWIDGSFEVYPELPFPANVAKCRLKLGAGKDATWAKGKLNEDQVKFLVLNRAKYIACTEKAAQISAVMKLDDRQRKYVRHLLEQAPLQVSKAMAISSLMKATTRQLLFHLIDQGAFDLHETNPEFETPVPLEELGPMYKKMTAENHFIALTAHAVSIQEEIDRRFAKRLHEFDPKRYKKATPEQLKTLALIKVRLEEAYAVLGDEDSRRRYRSEIYSPFQLENFFHLQLEKAEAEIKMRASPKAALPLALSAWEIRPGHVAVGEIIINCLKALGRGSEAYKYKRLSLSPPPNK